VRTPYRGPHACLDIVGIIRNVRVANVADHFLVRSPQWLLKRHKRITWAELYRRFLTGRPGNRPAAEGITMFDTTTVAITRYRWRSSNIPTPWTSTAATSVTA
jgi:hypothetical protein